MIQIVGERRGDTQSSFTCHYRECDSAILWKEAEVIFKQNGYVERNFLESACISYTWPFNFNSKKGLYNVDAFIEHLLVSQYKLSSVLSVRPS